MQEMVHANLFFVNHYLFPACLLLGRNANRLSRKIIDIAVVARVAVSSDRVDDFESQHLRTYTALLLNLRCGTALSSRLNHVVV